MFELRAIPRKLQTVHRGLRVAQEELDHSKNETRLRRLKI
jgi:hypothetical protein